MDEEGPEEYDSAEDERKRTESELVSIRKKLIEPNNLLPAAMIRSQPPRHILPLPPQQLSRPGHRMPLDPQAQNLSQGEATATPKRRTSPKSRSKSKNQLPEFKKREQFRLNEDEAEPEQDLLQFLDGNIKKVLDYPQLVAFISRTAFVSNVKTNKFKPQPFTSKHQFREECMEYLNGNRHFASVPFAFDQPVDQSVGESLNFNENLQFSDDFQSSNLYMALQCDQQLANSFKKPGEKYHELYLLTVRLDYNTRSYGQWFYFKVKRNSGNRNAAPVSYKFIIINMTKNSSLFGRGLRVSVCRNGLWGKEGTNIRYYRNSLQREPMNGEVASILPTEHYQSLQFTLDLSSGQEIYVSYNEPYSYSRVGRLLDKMSSRFEHNQHNIINFKRAELCTTYLNNSIEVVTVSARRATHPLHLSIDDKKVIFIMARTHPVETAGSHVVQGILNEIYRLFIESPKEEHRSHLLYRLLQQYILKIIPMANPDGVITGNSRCNLPGYDLNRCWKSPRYDLSKEVYSIKRHVFLYNRRVEMFLDLHAHSKKMNVFAYGCHDTSDPYSSRQFPFLLSKLSRQDFLFQECRFTRLADPRQSNPQKKSAKDGTARVFLYDSLRIPNIFTIENSYCAARNSAFHYDRHSYAVIGADILTAISLYFSPQFKGEWNGQKREQPERTRPQQSHIKISLNASLTSDVQLKLTINSEKPRGREEEDVARCKNPHALREKYLFELRQREENIKIGLQKDNEVSESEEEDRIYQPSPKKKTKPKTSSQAGLRKVRGEAKTDRLLHQISKNGNKHSPEKASNKQSILNLSHISSTHSETNLARITKVAKNKFQTINKPEEMILIPDQACHEQYTKQRQKLLSRRQRPPTQFQGSRRKKNDNCLSIVQIGLNNEVEERQIEERIIVLDRFEAKDRLKTFHGFREPKVMRNQTQPKQQAVHRQQKQKDDEIKQYLRRIMKPKAELVEQEKSRPVRGQRLVRLQSERSRQSQLQFNDLRRSKLVILQNHKQFRLNHQKSSVPQ